MGLGAGAGAGAWGGGERKMTQRRFWKEKPGTKQAHFTTLPSTDVCLQS